MDVALLVHAARLQGLRGVAVVSCALEGDRDPRGVFLTLISRRVLPARARGFEVGTHLEFGGQLHSFYLANTKDRCSDASVIELESVKVNGTEHLMKKGASLIGLQALELTLSVTGPTLLMFTLKNPLRRSIGFSLYAYLRPIWEPCTSGVQAAFVGVVE